VSGDPDFKTAQLRDKIAVAGLKVLESLGTAATSPVTAVVVPIDIALIYSASTAWINTHTHAQSHSGLVGTSFSFLARLQCTSPEGNLSVLNFDPGRGLSRISWLSGSHGLVSQTCISVSKEIILFPI
jgi:hypothetical protein